jgi:hypothetical protein
VVTRCAPWRHRGSGARRRTGSRSREVCRGSRRPTCAPGPFRSVAGSGCSGAEGRGTGVRLRRARSRASGAVAATPGIPAGVARSRAQASWWRYAFAALIRDERPTGAPTGDEPTGRPAALDRPAIRGRRARQASRNQCLGRVDDDELDCDPAPAYHPAGASPLPTSPPLEGPGSHPLRWWCRAQWRFPVVRRLGRIGSGHGAPRSVLSQLIVTGGTTPPGSRQVAGIPSWGLAEERRT